MNKKYDVLDKDTNRTKGIDALTSNIEAAKAVAEIIKTTLGPMGMDKMLIDNYGDSIITNDGVKILEEMEIEHPGAKLLVNVAKTQETEVGDGTTSAVILSSRLLSEAQNLLEKNIHPNMIIQSYNLASKKALEILEKESLSIKLNDEKLISQICQTAMTGKISENYKEHIAKLLSQTIKNSFSQKNSFDKENLKIQKVIGGSIKESHLFDGIILDKKLSHINMNKSIKNSRIILLDFPLEIKELDSNTRVNLNSVEEYNHFLDAQKEYLKNVIVQLKKLNANFIVCQKNIDDSISYYLAKEGILAVKRVKKSDLEFLSKALEIPITSSLDDLREKNIGFANQISVKKIINEEFVFIEGYKKKYIQTLFLRSSTPHILDELERAIHDALGDIKSLTRTPSIVAGGGAIELKLYTELKRESQKINSKNKMCYEAYANSFLSIPEILCKNCGFDEIELLSKLISLHNQNKNHAGIDWRKGIILNTAKEGIIEPSAIKSQAIKSATEISNMILRIDDIIAAKKINKNSE